MRLAGKRRKERGSVSDMPEGSNPVAKTTSAIRSENFRETKTCEVFRKDSEVGHERNRMHTYFFGR